MGDGGASLMPGLTPLEVDHQLEIGREPIPMAKVAEGLYFSTGAYNYCAQYNSDLPTLLQYAFTPLWAQTKAHLYVYFHFNRASATKIALHLATPWPGRHRLHMRSLHDPSVGLAMTQYDFVSELVKLHDDFKLQLQIAGAFLCGASIRRLFGSKYGEVATNMLCSHGVTMDTSAGRAYDDPINGYNYLSCGVHIDAHSTTPRNIGMATQRALNDLWLPMAQLEASLPMAQLEASLLIREYPDTSNIEFRSIVGQDRDRTYTCSQTFSLFEAMHSGSDVTDHVRHIIDSLKAQTTQDLLSFGLACATPNDPVSSLPAHRTPHNLRRQSL